MRNKTLLFANMKKQRGSLLSILILIFIITVSLCAVLAIWKNSNAYEEGEMDRLRFGNISAWIMDAPENSGLITPDDLQKEMEEVDATECVERQSILYVYYVINGEEISTQGQVTGYEPEIYDYHIFKENLTSFEEEVQTLGCDEIYVTPAFASLYDSKPGDVVGIKVSEGKVHNYVIKGYFEDPFMGSAMMGIKTILMREEDRLALAKECEEAGEESLVSVGSVFHIFMKENQNMTVTEYQSILNEQTKLPSVSMLMYQKATISGFMLILQNMFSGFLLTFVAILLAVAVIVMSHSINSSMEQDYVNIGILKAVGFTEQKLRNIMLVQYLFAVLGGVIPGFFVSKSVVSLINKMTVTATGLLIPNELPLALVLSILGGIILFLMLVIVFKTAKVGSISPIRAIRGGAEDVYFKNKTTFSVHKKGVGFWLAMRQLSFGKKQYAGVLIITTMLVFFLSVTTRSRAWMGSDGQGLMNAFGASSYDIQVLCTDENLWDEVDATVRANADVIDSYQFKLDRGSIKGIEYTINIISDPSQYHVISGRTCVYDNELIMTEMTANELDVSVGDTVIVNYADTEKEFIVTGINQCANDLGANFSINKEGFERLGGPEDAKYFTYYALGDYTMRQPVMDLLKETYGDEVETEENTWSGLASILGAMSGLTMMMYIVSIIFIFIVTTMTGSKILYKEQHDLGTYRSLGYTARRLRVAFALRFGITALIGSVFGVILSAFLTNPIVSAGVKMCGISSFDSEFSFIQAVIPAAIIILSFVVVSYLEAGKIRRVEPTILIAES